MKDHLRRLQQALGEINQMYAESQYWPKFREYARRSGQVLCAEEHHLMWHGSPVLLEGPCPDCLAAV